MCAYLSIGSSVSGQSLDNYRKQRTQLDNSIQVLDQSLQGKQKERYSLSKSYRLLAKKIEKREELQYTIERELALLDSMIYLSDQSLSDMLIRQENYKERLIILARQNYYQRKLSNRWLDLLLNNQIKESLIEWRRNAQLQDYSSNQIDQLRALSDTLQDSIGALQTIKQSKYELLTKEEQNLYALQSEYDSSNDLLDQLNSDEERLQEEIRKRKLESRRLNNIIIDMIKKEKVKLASTTTPLVNTDFASSRGKMPWPVTEGVITERFGVKQHPVLKQVKIENHGIDMICPSGTQVGNIHQGKVLLVTQQAPYDKIVIVSHGEYTTAYYYLNQVYVQKGEEVAAGQIIGRLGRDDSNKDFHFEVWHHQKQMDPEMWLIKK